MCTCLRSPCPLQYHSQWHYCMVKIGFKIQEEVMIILSSYNCLDYIIFCSYVDILHHWAKSFPFCYSFVFNLVQASLRNQIAVVHLWCGQKYSFGCDPSPHCVKLRNTEVPSSLSEDYETKSNIWCHFHVTHWCQEVFHPFDWWNLPKR